MSKSAETFGLLTKFPEGKPYPECPASQGVGVKKGRAGKVAVEYSVYTAVSGAEHSRTNVYIPESIATYTHAEGQTSVCGVVMQ